MESRRDDFVIALRSAFLKKGNQQKFSLLTLILFSIFFLILGNFNFKIVNANRTIIREIIYFSSFVVTVPENALKKSFNKITDHFELYNENLIEKNELKILKNKDLEKSIMTYENVELKKLIDDYFVLDSQAYAKVLIDKESPFLRSIVINKGSKNGVKTGMVVYDDIYLVGKIVEVNFLTSRVLLISDINSKVPVTIQPLNVQGIMSGLKQQSGQLEYINNDETIVDNGEKLIVVTSGAGGIFKSGIPIGNINLTSALVNNKIVVNFYRNFSQLKYVKILSYEKINTNIDQSNKITFKKNSDRITELKSQAEDINLLQQQKVINDKIRAKLELDNIGLREILINTQKKLADKNKKIKNDQVKSQNIKFLELNLVHGHKCRKSFLKSNLYKINTPEYKKCVLNKGYIKKN